MFGVWRPRDGDERHGGAFQFERLYAKVTPWRLILLAAGVVAYLAGLVIFLPAEAAVGSQRDAVGTVWKGQAALDPGFAVDWKVRPWASLASFAGVADVALTGPETAFEGRIAARGDDVTVRTISGAGSTRVLSALAPALPFACDGELTANGEDLSLRGGRVGAGRLRTGTATCAAPGGPATPIPPLTAALASDAEGLSATVSDATNAALARIRTGRDGAVHVVVEPTAGGVLPGVTPMTLDTRL